MCDMVDYRVAGGWVCVRRVYGECVKNLVMEEERVEWDKRNAKGEGFYVEADGRSGWLRRDMETWTNGTGSSIVRQSKWLSRVP